MASDIKAKLVERKTIATDTILLTLKPTKKISFQAGQYFWLILPDLITPDPKGNLRAFSTISPAGSDTLSFVYRVSQSGFKQTLGKMPLGSEIYIRGPRGCFIPKASELQLVCIAGGTGIAPFISLAETRTLAKSGQVVHIFAHNSTPDREILSEKFSKLSSSNPNIKYYSIMDEFNWSKVRQIIGLQKFKLLISGPERFVNSVASQIDDINTDNENIHFEEFFGLNISELNPPNKILDSDFHLAVKESPNHIIFTDPDGKIIFANRAAELITGYSFTEMQGNTPRLWGGLMSYEFYQDLWTTIKKKRQPFKGQVKNIRKNGETYYALARISPIINEQNMLMGFIGTEEDVTEYVNTASELKDSRDNLVANQAKDQAVFKSLSSGLVVTDTLGRISMVNLAFENMLGWTEDEVLGKDMLDVLVKLDEKGQIIPSEKRSLTLVLNHKQTEASQSNISQTHSYRTKSGSLLPIIGTVTPITINGELVGAVQVFYDITRNKEIDEMKSDFIHLASHQLRTPLTSIRWNLELLKKTTPQLNPE